MRRLLAFCIFTAVLLCSSSTMFAAADKKDGKDGKDKPDKGHEPIFLPFLIWNGAWSPVMREVPMENPTNTFMVTEANIESL